MTADTPEPTTGNGKPAEEKEFPEGTTFAVGHTDDKELVFLEFPVAVKKIGFHPDDARTLADLLSKHARLCR